MCELIVSEYKDSDHTDNKMPLNNLRSCEQFAQIAKSAFQLKKTKGNQFPIALTDILLRARCS